MPSKYDNLQTEKEQHCISPLLQIEKDGGKSPGILSRNFVYLWISIRLCAFCGLWWGLKFINIYKFIQTPECAIIVITNLKQLWRRLQSQRKKKNKTIVFMSKTTALHVHHTSQYISLTSTERLRRETSQCGVAWKTWTYFDKFSFLYFNMDKALKNSTPGKVAYIWRIERFQLQMDAIKFERAQIQCFLVMFYSIPIGAIQLTKRM